MENNIVLSQNNEAQIDSNWEKPTLTVLSVNNDTLGGAAGADDGNLGNS